MAEHTPGPWFVKRMYEGSRTIAMMRDWNGNVALAVHGPQNWIQERNATEQIEANAHLVAAAPDLLRVVRKLHRALEVLGYEPCDENCWSIMEQAEIAIAKAEGREVPA